MKVADEYGKQCVRIYVRPSFVTSCLNCGSIQPIKNIIGIKFRCMEFPDEIKEVDFTEVLKDGGKPFMDFCPLDKTRRSEFEKKRGW